MVDNREVRTEETMERAKRNQGYAPSASALPPGDHTGIAGRGSFREKVYPYRSHGSGLVSLNIGPSIGALGSQEQPRAFILRPDLQPGNVQTESRSHAGARANHAGRQMCPKICTYKPGSSLYEESSKPVFPCGSGCPPQCHASAKVQSRRKSKDGILRSPAVSSDSGVSGLITGFNPSCPAETERYSTFRRKVPLIDPNPGQQILPVEHDQMGSRNSSSLTQYIPDGSAATHSRSSSKDLGPSGDIRLHDLGRNYTDQSNAAGILGGVTFVEPRSAVSPERKRGANLSHSCIRRKVVSNRTKKSSKASIPAYVLANCISSPTNVTSEQCLDYSQLKNFVQQRASVRAAPSVVDGQTDDKSTTKSKDGAISDCTVSLRIASSLPSKGKPAISLWQPAKKRTALLHETATKLVETTNAVQSSRFVSTSAGSFHRHDYPQVCNGVSRKRSTSKVNKGARLSVFRSRQRRAPCKGTVEATDVESLPGFDGSIGDRTNQAIPDPSQPVAGFIHPMQEHAEPLVPQASLPSQLSRRVPYSKPIVPPAHAEDDMPDYVISEGIRKRFGVIVNGYIFHNRSGWLMHPSFYDYDHSLCKMKWICRHSRDCHEIRKRMAVFACIRHGISYRESEYVWGISRSCIQRNTLPYKGKISLDFLITPIRRVRGVM